MLKRLSILFVLIFTVQLSSAADKRKHRKRIKNIESCSIVTNDLLVKNDAQFNGNITVKGDVTVEGEIHEIRNRFHGWWRKVSRTNASFLAATPELIFINAIDTNNITAQVFGGTLAYYFEYHDPNPSFIPYPIKIVNDRVLGFFVDTSSTVTVNGITGTFPDNLNFYFTVQEGGEFDGLAFMGNSNPDENNFFQLSAQGDLYEKLTFNMAVGDQIRPWGNGDNAFRDANSRRFMFEQIDQIFFGNNTPAFSPAGTAELLMPRPQRLTLRDAILNDGVERDPVAIYDIHTTTKDSGTTTLLVKGTYPYVNFASTITVSGLAGAWAQFNNDYQVVGIYNTDNESVQEQDPFFQAATRTYHVLIRADSSLMPVFNTSIHAPLGALIQPAKVGPITEDIEYRQWCDAAIYYSQRVYQQTTHATFRPYCEAEGTQFIDTIDTILRKSPLATWDDVSSALAGNLPLSNRIYRYRAEVVAGSLIAPSYYLPYYPSLTNTQLNEPFTQLGIPGSDILPDLFPSYAIGSLPILGFNVPFENYLLPESRRWLYFRIKPNTAVTNAQQENVWIIGYDSDGNLIPELRGYASVGPNGLNTGGQLGGSRFEGLMSRVPWGEDDPSIVDGFWSPFTDWDPFDPTTLNVGIINPALVGGKKIGYIQTIANILHDPFYLSLYINFGDSKLATDPDPEMRKRQQYDGETAVLAELMRYFVVEQQVDAIILDNRINAGGFGTQSFYESFGGARKGGTSLSAFQDQDNRKAYNVDKEMVVFGGPTGSDDLSLRKLIDTTPWPTVRPDLMEKRYPGSVFKNGPVIILDSQSAGSGGDQFPRYFIGDNLDGNIGNGVQTHVVGTIHGLLFGYSDRPTPMIMSKYGSEFPVEVDGQEVGASPVFALGENIIYNEIAGTLTSTRYDPRTDFSTPIEGLVPVNSNITGPIYPSSNTGSSAIVQGPLSTNISDTVYFDFGYRGPGTAVDGTPYAPGHWDNPPVGIDQVNGFPGQPDPADPATLRDSWFEESIRVTRLALGDVLTKNKRRARTPNEKKSRPTSSSVAMAANRFKTEKDVEAFVIKKESFRDTLHKRGLKK